MSFKDIRAQDNAIEFLRNSVKNNKVSHAYLFVGPPGVGKKFTALNFAKALNCLNGKDGSPCDACIQCKKIDSSNHPDVQVFSPLKEDSSLGIDKVRAVTKDIGLKPYEGRKKVYIIDAADSMTQQAQNALLKTLEEPPSDSVLILIAENVNAIFETILSRAKKVRFFSLPAEDVGKILEERYEIEKEKAGLLASISSGELGKAVKFNNEDFFAKRNRIINSLKSGAVSETDLDGFSKSDLKIALDVILTWYRDVLVAKTIGDRRELLINVDKLDLIYDEAEKSTFDELNKIINQVILTSSFLDQNVNMKLAMGVLGVNLARR